MKHCALAPLPGTRRPRRRHPVARLRRGRADAPRRLARLAGARPGGQLRAAAARPARRAAARPPLVPGQPAERAPVAEPGLHPVHRAHAGHRRDGLPVGAAVAGCTWCSVRRCGWLGGALAARAGAAAGPPACRACGSPPWACSRCRACWGCWPSCCGGEQAAYGGALARWRRVRCSRPACRCCRRRCAWWRTRCSWSARWAAGGSSGSRHRARPPTSAGARPRSASHRPAWAWWRSRRRCGGSHPPALPWLIPVGLPLLLAIPIATFTSRSSVGERWRAAGLLWVPEESQPPAVLRRAAALQRRAAGTALQTDPCRHRPGAPVASGAPRSLRDPTLMSTNLNLSERSRGRYAGRRRAHARGSLRPTRHARHFAGTPDEATRRRSLAKYRKRAAAYDSTCGPTWTHPRTHASQRCSCSRGSACSTWPAAPA